MPNIDDISSGRNRAYTWHGHARNTVVCDSNDACNDNLRLTSKMPSSKKPWSRRNAWGDLSYADLIANAIESTPDRRMTLAQIYDWMVQNVPYFKDKGHSNSSAGWKNSVRHNLSLHRRFRRVLNDDNGKSSWWMLNDGVTNGRHKTSAVNNNTKVAAHNSMTILPVSHSFPEVTGCETNNESAESMKLMFSDCGILSRSSASLPDWKLDYPSSIVVTSNVNGETSENQDGAMGWIQYSVAQLSSVNDAECVLESACSPSSYPMPLLPITEVFEPAEPSSCSVQLVELHELQTPSAYGDYQFQPSAGDNTFITAAINKPVSSNLGDAWCTSMCSSSQNSSIGTPRCSQSVSVQNQGPGWSLLCQMLMQSHHENSIMNGISCGHRTGDFQPAAAFTRSTGFGHEDADAAFVSVSTDELNSYLLEEAVAKTADSEPVVIECVSVVNESSSCINDKMDDAKFADLAVSNIALYPVHAGNWETGNSDPVTCNNNNNNDEDMDNKDVNNKNTNCVTDFAQQLETVQ